MDRRGFLGLAGLAVAGMIPQALSLDGQLADIKRRVTDLESSPDLYGATITGSLIRTSEDGSRLELSSGSEGWQAGEIKFESEEPAFADMRFGKAGSLTIRSESGAITTRSGVELTASPDQSVASVNLYALDPGGISNIILDYGGIVHIFSQNGVTINSGGGYLPTAIPGVVEIGGSAGVTLRNLPTISGVTSNLYVDPGTDEIKRIV